jgi:hypothetical protein
MDIQEIEVTIDKSGQVQLHVSGVKGSACLLITQDLEKSLGGDVIIRDMTPDALDQIQVPLKEVVKLSRSKK